MINKNFTLLWVGKIVSQFGDKFYGIALAWWILQKTNSPSIMGFFLLVSVLPGIILGLYAGALTDRWNRKAMLIVTDIIRGCLVIAICYLSMNAILEIWHVFLIGFSLSLVTAFFEPAIQAIVPQVVEKENLTKANSLSQIVSGICMVAGPLLGAIAVSVLGLSFVFLLNSISYFFSALLACFIVVKKVSRDTAVRGNIWKDMYEGICFIRNQKRIILLLKVIAIAHFFLGSLMVSLPFLANGLQGDGVKNLGYLEMMLGIGLIVGSVFMGINKRGSITERRLLAFILVVGLCFLIISITQLLKIQTVYAYTLILIVIGTCTSCASVFWQSLLQSHTPSHMTGRVFSISSLIGNTSLPLAFAVFGALLNISSIYIVMSVCGISLIVLCCLLLLRNLKMACRNH